MFLVPAKGHPVYTLTKIKRNLLIYTHQEQTEKRPASYRGGLMVGCLLKVRTGALILAFKVPAFFGFRVRVQGSGFRVQGSGFRV